MVRLAQIFLFAVCFGGFATAAPKGWALFDDKIEPVFIKYCHGDGMDKGDFAMDEFDLVAGLLKDIDVWFAPHPTR
ncbi:MAG: hypothetical protein P1V20_32015, partial [Verrucomicrobiales bacterium]|nr:hypothetical protein [Verrucomicrobiales bacterium]